MFRNGVRESHSHAGLDGLAVNECPVAPIGEGILPHADFAMSVATLDTLRLGEQRVEALQVLRALTRPGYRWQHHPAVRMWRAHAEAVAAYGLAVCAEWVGGVGRTPVPLGSPSTWLCLRGLPSAAHRAREPPRTFAPPSRRASTPCFTTVAGLSFDDEPTFVSSIAARWKKLVAVGPGISKVTVTPLSCISSWTASAKDCKNNFRAL